MEAFDTDYTVQVYRFKRIFLYWDTQELDYNAITPNVINMHIRKTPLHLPFVWRWITSLPIYL